MNEDIKQIAGRIKELREILEIPADEMAGLCGITTAQYLAYEEGKSDFSFTFLFVVARRFGVDITDLLTGEATRLSLYTVVRNGEGLPIRRREGFTYQNMAYLFKNRLAEPYVVEAPYVGALADEDIPLSSHAGQELDMVIQGSLKVVVNSHAEILHEGDCIYYNSATAHGMTAWDEKPCKFLAVVMGETKK